MSTLRSILTALARALLQFFPLTVFLNVAWLHGAPQGADWLRGFVWGGGAAAAQLAVNLRLARGQPLNRLILGANVYLMIGGVAALSRHASLLGLLDVLKETALFLSLLATGLATTGLSRAGLLAMGAESLGVPTRDARVATGTMLTLMLAAVAISLRFQGQLLISAVLPMITLTLAYRWFRARLRPARTDGTTRPAAITEAAHPERV